MSDLHPLYIRDTWQRPQDKTPKVVSGDYVLATKYADGDPGDHWCVGLYAGNYDHFGSVRHMVNDADGISFRANGFRRVAKISRPRGKWIVEHIHLIEQRQNQYSVWHWYRAPWRELKSIPPHLVSPRGRTAEEGGGE